MTFYFNPDDFLRTDLWKRITESFDKPISLTEAYINYADHATVNFPHCDGRNDGPTILICINQEWKRDLFGYTVFFKDMNSNDIIRTIVPEPGKAVIFKGSLWHSATPIAHYASYPRFMLAVRCLMK